MLALKIAQVAIDLPDFIFGNSGLLQEAIIVLGDDEVLFCVDL